MAEAGVVGAAGVDDRAVTAPEQADFFFMLGRLEGKALPREKLALVSALLGVDRFDALTTAMGEVGEL